MVLTSYKENKKVVCQCLLQDFVFVAKSIGISIGRPFLWRNRISAIFFNGESVIKKDK